MRCPDCNKFVSYGEPEIEVDSEQITDGMLEVEATMYLTCAECGSQLKSCAFYINTELGHDCDGAEYDVEIGTEATDRFETKRDGKPIKPRYQKRFFGIEFTATVKCLSCDQTFNLSESVEEQASFFEELC